MTQISRTALAADIANNIYTNTQRRIKGNTVRDRMINVIDSSLNIIDDANVAGGYLAIDTNGRVDVTFINSDTPTGKFLKDDGTWDTAGGDFSADIAVINGRLDNLEAQTFTLQEVTDADNATTNAIYLNRPDGQPALVVVHSGLDCIDMGVRSGGGGYINLKDEADNTTIVMRGTDGGFMQIGGYDVVTANVLTAYQATSEKGANNGYASLDSGGKVPASQLPSTLMTLMGSWNATTNTPTLANGVGDVGDVYECTVAGTVDFGAGPITFKVGDWAVCGAGSVWYKSLNSNEVTSVNGQTGTVTLTSDHISEGTNLYFTDARARAAAVENNLTASTTVAPSKTAVNNALALKRDIDKGVTVIYRDFTDSEPLTGTTAITLINSALIPANTVAVNDEIEIYARAQRNTAIGNHIPYLYYNTSDSLSGATLIGTGVANASGSNLISRRLFVKASNDTETIPAASAAFTDYSSTTGTSMSNLNIDWTNNVYIIQAHQNAANGDSTKSRGIIIKRSRL